MEQHIDLQQLPGHDISSDVDVEFSDDLRDRKITGRRPRRYSRERDRERKENRKRRHGKRSHRKCSSDDPSRSPSNSRSRSRQRSKNHTRRNYSSHSNGSSDEINRDRPERSRRIERQTQPPNSTIMVRGLAPHLGENDIREEILKCGIMAKDVRLIKHRETGCSRGFAFVEFNTVQDASRWMEMKKGVLSFEGLPHASLIYSIPKMIALDHENKSAISDWFCEKCQAHNFRRRTLCYKCQSFKPDNIDAVGSSCISVHPTNTIVLGNLDALTTEDTILHAFEQRSTLATVPIRSVRICRDSLTNLSNGICYVETNNIADATRLFSALHQDSFEVDNRRVTVAYSKPTSQHATAIASSVAATALAAARWSVQGDNNRSVEEVYSQQDEVENLAKYSASLYAKTPEEHASYLIYYRGYYLTRLQSGRGMLSSTSIGVGSSTKTMMKTCEESATGSDVPLPYQETDKLHTSAGKDFANDEAKGHYSDTMSGFHYDPSTQYFSDANRRQSLNWNTAEDCHLAVSQKSVDTSSPEKKLKMEHKTEQEDVAKRITKDMEKWTKTLHKRKDCNKFLDISEQSSACAGKYTQRGAVEGLRTTNGHLESEIFNASNISTSATINQDGNQELQRTNSGTVDFVKLSCLTCKRRFPTKEILLKHIDFSELHKTNIRRNTNTVSSYRDRGQGRLILEKD